ncbi:MAG TPA: hypothetical protein VKE22_20565 [Haliangiales bacterium]|nr:hypothetical protein [Haliangiales bacterium]
MRPLLLLALLVPACAAMTVRSQTRRALETYTDGHGQYVAVSFQSRQLFFGREGTFWSLRTYPAVGGRIGFHDPRLVLPGVLAKVPQGLSVTCLDKAALLEAVTEDEANAIMDEATFEQQQPTSTPVALGVDKDGSYAYVDVEGNERRLFMGSPGKVRRIEVKSAEGTAAKFRLATAAGTIEVAVGARTDIAWNGTPLTALDPVAHWKLVFEELRVYPVRSPTPCDLVM